MLISKCIFLSVDISTAYTHDTNDSRDVRNEKIIQLIRCKVFPLPVDNWLNN